MLAAPSSAIAASASTIESAPPEQARPYRPGPRRSCQRLTSLRTTLVVGMRTNDTPMSERDTSTNGPTGPLARLRAQLAGPRGYKKIDALLSAEDAPAVIAALSPSEIFELVHEVGFEDAQPLIEYATPAQIQGAFDLDGWSGDHLELAPLRPWLAALVEAGFEKVGE